MENGVDSTGLLRSSNVSERLVDSVLFQQDLFERIIANLSRPESASLLLVSKEMAKQTKTCWDQKVCRERLVVACSRNGLLVEINVHTGEVVRSANGYVPNRPRRYTFPRQERPNWLTGVAFSPYDHNLYVCNYKIPGVQLHHGTTLQRIRIFVKLNSGDRPEGLAFCNNALFIANLEGQKISKHNLEGELLQYLDFGPEPFVAWGLRAGRSSRENHLFVAIDSPFEAGHYNRAPESKAGVVWEVWQGENDPVTTSVYSIITHAPDYWTRPSGLWVESAEQGFVTLYVTSCSHPIMKQSLHADPEDHQADTKYPDWPQATNPNDDNLVEGEKQWDVCLLNSKIYATVHGCKKENSRIHEYSMEGRLLRVFRSQLFNEPNMMDKCY